MKCSVLQLPRRPECLLCSGWALLLTWGEPTLGTYLPHLLFPLENANLSCQWAQKL